MKLHAEIFASGKNTTGIRVPTEVVESLGKGKHPPVRVTINDYTYRTSIAFMGGEFLLPVSQEVRERAKVAAGDALDIDIELDTEPREVTVPPDFAEALDADPQARQFFDSLSYSNKRWHVETIEGAKAAETRQRRIEKSVGMLHEGRAR